MKRYIEFTVFTTVLICSCTKEPEFTTEIINQPVYQLPKVPELHIDEFISSDAGIYLKSYETTDFYVQLSSLKPSPIDKEEVSAISGQRYYHSTKTINNLCPYQIKINGVPVTDIKSPTKVSSPQTDLRKFYGETIVYEFSPITSTKSTNESISVSQYVPELIEITSPRVSNEDEMYPVCYGGNFILRWNADPKNTEGLIVSVEWMGKKLYGFDYDGQTVRRTMFIPEDNGECKLDPKLFDHIPNTALVFITLLRGNIQNKLIGDYSYNISCETHAVLPIILCRKMRTI